MSSTLTPNDMANRETIAKLRAHAGALRARIVSARNLLLKNEHMMPPTCIERDALTILSDALRIEAP
jgi:hypothetical protein